MVRLDGAVIHVEAAAAPFEDDDGPAVQLVLRDVTDRRESAAALEHQRLRLEGIVNSAMDGIVTVDDERRIVLFNAAAERMFRCEAGEALGSRIDRFVPDRFRDAHARHMEAFSATGESARAMGRFGAVSGVRADGEEFPLEASIAHVEVHGKRLFTVTCRDVSERRALEAQLRHAQKMEALGLLAGGIAHDFNNLLTIIHGNAVTLEEDELDQAERADCQTEIREAAERAAALTRQLLVFSRKQAVERTEVNVNAVVEGVTKMLKRVLGEHVSLRVELAPDLPPVRGDVGMVEQVLLNLAVNGRDAMPDGGTLTVRTTAAERAAHARGAGAPSQGTFVCLSVADDGCGIPPENLTRIFEPYFTTKELGRGTGLGLATVHGIAQQHGGWVEVDSEVGRGTVFRVFFHTGADGAVAARGEPAPRAPHLPRGTETILVVEDEAPVSTLVRRILERVGYRVLVAASGPEALGIAQREHVDLLLTDMVMPGGMSGRELAMRLRLTRPGLPVVLMSGYSAELSSRLPTPAGSVFLPKPFTPEKLARAVRSALDEATYALARNAS